LLSFNNIVLIFGSSIDKDVVWAFLTFLNSGFEYAIEPYVSSILVIFDDNRNFIISFGLFEHMKYLY